MSAGASGFFGKIPARGDFVRSGLPGGFVAAWDAWLQAVIPVSRDLLGEDWLPAWLEAPIWHFALDHGLCGDDAVLGMWMPSVDRAGRHFPLTLATVVPGATVESLAGHGAEWLAAAQRAGLDAVTSDATPEQLAVALSEAPCFDNGIDLTTEFATMPAASSAASRWWTEGAPLVGARTLATSGLPDGPTFTAMLDDRFSGASQ
jgi:type VI secretion system protein ImpM